MGRKKKNKIKIYGSFVIVVLLLLLSVGGAAQAVVNRASANEGNNIGIGESIFDEIKTDDAKFGSMTCTFYDYYSDSQITEGPNPGEITDGVLNMNNTFSAFNYIMLTDKKYGIPGQSVTKYPLYLGVFHYSYYNGNFIDMMFNGDYFNSHYNKNKIKVGDLNFWLGANIPQVEGDYAATQGLVHNRLDNKGNIIQQSSQTKKTGILPFFDDNYIVNTKHKDSQLSLGEVRKNVEFPVVVSKENGVKYYSFDSSEDTVRFESKTKLKYLGKNKEQVRDDGWRVGFFPYSGPKDSRAPSLNYGFGMKTEIPFAITEDGKLGNEDIIFEFSGDDDLWIFIDGILALDIGGTHGPVNGSINFAKRCSTVSAVKNNAIAFSLPNLATVYKGVYTDEDLRKFGIKGNISPREGVLNDVETAFDKNLVDSLKKTNEKHIMTIFFLERGKGCSNFKIKYNLPDEDIIEDEEPTLPPEEPTATPSFGGVKILNGDDL